MTTHHARLPTAIARTRSAAGTSAKFADMYGTQKTVHDAHVSAHAPPSAARASAGASPCSCPTARKYAGMYSAPLCAQSTQPHACACASV